MHVIITDAHGGATHTIECGPRRIVLSILALLVFSILGGAALYHGTLKIGQREGWPIIQSIYAVVDTREIDAQNRYLRENLDVMSKRLGELQAKMVQLDALGEHVADMAGVEAKNLQQPPGSGGVLVSPKPVSLEEFNAALTQLEGQSAASLDLLTVLESRVSDQKMERAQIPTSRPVRGGYLGSRFGRRIDPFTGSSAMHTGLDFAGVVGQTIYAAAGGVVVTAYKHAEYGNMVEIDHGNEVITRYAHASRILITRGDLVKRGQAIAMIGTTGRSTGPHLHFEVWVGGRYKDPAKFLALGKTPLFGKAR